MFDKYTQAIQITLTETADTLHLSLFALSDATCRFHKRCEF